MSSFLSQPALENLFVINCLHAFILALRLFFLHFWRSYRTK